MRTEQEMSGRITVSAVDGAVSVWPKGQLACLPLLKPVRIGPTAPHLEQ